MSIRLAALTLLGILAAACTANPGQLASSSAKSASTAPSPRASSSANALASPAARPVTELPVDASIEPVSLSDPSSEAADALRICQVGDTIGSEMVSGMGRIDHARDAVRYVSLTGLEPEIQTDAPAWIVTFKGEVPMPKSGEIWADPTCIVVKGDGGFYATGPVKILASAVTVTPLPAKQKPDLALPPLLP
jgi:hypothetical protein